MQRLLRHLGRDERPGHNAFVSSRRSRHLAHQVPYPLDAPACEYSLLSEYRLAIVNSSLAASTR